MGHLAGKDLFRDLGQKLDSLGTRAPWNDKLYAILKELYSEEEADVVIKMPGGLSTLEQIEYAVGLEKSSLQKILDRMTEKGLVIDLWIGGQFYYTPSPMVIGVFEFTMMRTRGNLNTREWAKLFHEYFHSDNSYFEANFGNGEKYVPFRTLSHESALESLESVEIFDYEKASALLSENNRFAIGLCSCRHKQQHVDPEGACGAPLESCSSFGWAADYLVRHHLAREATRQEMEDLVAKSKEMGLVLTVENVRKKAKFLCHCCKCCCTLLLGIRVHGCPNTIVTSSFIASIDGNQCVKCGRCVSSCPVDAITVPVQPDTSRGKQIPKIDETICLGCGVCAMRCAPKACSLISRSKRVIPPETAFERILFQSLENGTLQHQIFDEPQSVNQKIMRAFVGGFLKLPPVKMALTSDRFRSSFLNYMKKQLRSQGKGWLLDL